MATSSRAFERLDLRLPQGTKERWARAAELAGAASVSSFVEMVVTERADALIREHDALTLSDEDSTWLRAFLSEPAREPTPALQRAAQRHRELFGDE